MIRVLKVIVLSSIIIILGCKNSSSELQNTNSTTNIPQSVIQAFINDNNRGPKIRQYNLQFARENFQLTKDIIVENIRLRKYTLPSECGSCLDYNLIAIGEDQPFTCPINMESILINSLQELEKDTASGNLKNEKVNSVISHHVSVINAYLSEKLNINEAKTTGNLGKSILTEFLFDYTLSEAVKEFRIDPIEYNLEEYLSDDSDKYYFWINGVIFESDRSKLSIKQPVNVSAINPMDYINVRY